MVHTRQCLFAAQMAQELVDAYGPAVYCFSDGLWREYSVAQLYLWSRYGGICVVVGERAAQ